MQTKANAALFLPGPMTANDPIHLPLEDNISELMIPLGCLLLSLTKAFLSMLISNTSYDIIKTSSYHNYSTCFLRLVETFITNCFPRRSPLQARLPCSSIAILALQHQHNQFGSSPKSGSTVDKRATSLYSTRSLQTDVQSYYTVSKCLIVRAGQKCFLTAADHPKRLALQNYIPQRIAIRYSFRRKSAKLLSILIEEFRHCQVFNLFPSPSWLASSFCTKQVYSTIPGISGRDNPHNLYRRFRNCRNKEWWGCSNYLQRLTYSTSHCKYHQNKGQSIHQLLRGRDCCHGSCFILDLHKPKLSPDFHPHLHRQLITM